jgi:hypothetical protein
MTYESQPARDCEPATGAGQAARTAGRGLLWLAIVAAVVTVLAGVLLLGPFGLAIAVPALLVIWFAAASTGGGPAAGA